MVGAVPATGKLAIYASNVTVIARRAGSEGRIFIIQGFSGRPILLQVSSGTLRVKRGGGGQESGGEGDCEKARLLYLLGWQPETGSLAKRQ